MVIAHVAYGLIVWGIVLLLRRLQVLPRARILVGFLVAGVVAGVASTWAWPADVAVLLNLPGVLLGDLVYSGSIMLFGDPSSPQAHFTIPWLLRVPQVYVLVSVLVYGLAGFIVQVAVNRKRK
jgi:phage shock protein PspC (stress-responsive transcriptional regulator)